MIFADWLLTPQRVAIHRPTLTAVVADLHLGYNDSRRRCGDAIPMDSMDRQLAPLIQVLKACDAKGLLIAGDLFERALDHALWRQFRELVRQAGVPCLGLIPGNHDRSWQDAPADMPILPEGQSLGTWRVVHGDGPLPRTRVVLGHFHPCVSYQGCKVPCYLAGSRRLALPAYSQDAAGVNIRRLDGWGDYRCLAIAAGQIIEVHV